MPTSTAVIADLIAAVRDRQVGPTPRVPPWGVPQRALRSLPVRPLAELEGEYYLRMMAVDRPGVLGRLGERPRSLGRQHRVGHPARARRGDGADRHADAPGPRARPPPRARGDREARRRPRPPGRDPDRGSARIAAGCVGGVGVLPREQGPRRGRRPTSRGSTPTPPTQSSARHVARRARGERRRSPCGSGRGATPPGASAGRSGTRCPRRRRSRATCARPSASPAGARW